MSITKACCRAAFDVGSRKALLPVMMQSSGSYYLSIAGEWE
jgi:hypothetical protein